MVMRICITKTDMANMNMAMVYMVHMSQGLSDDSGGNNLPYCTMLVRMVVAVASNRKHESLFVL